MLMPRGFKAVSLVYSVMATFVGAQTPEIPINCPAQPPAIPEIGRGDVYKDTPFKAGEIATYEVSWAGLKAGYATMEARSPIKHPIRGKPVWHRVFHVDASTGDWFKSIFVAKESMTALSRPWNYSVSHFYMDQNEGKLFSRPFVQKKWLDFDQEACKVHERIQQPEKPEDKKSFDLSYGAIDALGVVYQLRSRNFKIGRKERALVYTSEKNWWLDAEPLLIENVKVPAGEFKAVKLKLTTYLGKELQQKGDVFAWVATETPQRQLVQIQGEIKIGSVWIKLHQYKAGI